MNNLSNKTFTVDVPGKIILIGEHSVVYGHTAIAMPLSRIRLTLTLAQTHKKKWENVWQINMQGEPLKLNKIFKETLTESLRLAFSLFGYNLDDYKPQMLLIESNIPLGGGMGGSAAVSASLVKLCSQIFNQPLETKEEINFANQIDSLFHSGRASGLDVTAILTEKLIEYNKHDLFKIIEPKCSFYVALIDTNERAETRKMIQTVSNLVEQKNEPAIAALNHLNKLANQAVKDLQSGELFAFAEKINHAQICLQDLQVSTPTIELFCQKLTSLGALCAKLTGAGGGGLVLGIFEKDPTYLASHFPDNKIYITQI